MFEINSDNSMRITRGDDASFSVPLKIKGTGETYSMDQTDILYFTVKKDTGQPKALFQKKNTGSNSFSITPSDTNGLKYGEYVYDVELIQANGGDAKVRTVIEPTPFIVSEEVTW